MEENKILEGKDNDNLDTTSVSEPIVEEKVENEVEPVIPELNSSPVPSQEDEEVGESVGLEENGVEDEVVDPQPVESELAVSETVESENVEPEQVHEELGVIDAPATKTFTQAQVDDIAGKTRFETREKTFRYIYDRYGVKDEAELDDLIGNAQRYDSLQEEYSGAKSSWKTMDAERNKQLADLSEQVALMQSGIDNARYEDAKFILKGKGLEVNAENIKNELATHPEWQKKEKEEMPNPNFVKVGEPKNQYTQPETVSKMSVLGNESSMPKQESEEDYVMSRMFKV